MQNYMDLWAIKNAISLDEWDWCFITFCETSGYLMVSFHDANVDNWRKLCFEHRDCTKEDFVEILHTVEGLGSGTNFYRKAHDLANVHTWRIYKNGVYVPIHIVDRGEQFTTPLPRECAFKLD